MTIILPLTAWTCDFRPGMDHVWAIDGHAWEPMGSQYGITQIFQYNFKYYKIIILIIVFFIPSKRFWITLFHIFSKIRHDSEKSALSNVKMLAMYEPENDNLYSLLGKIEIVARNFLKIVARSSFLVSFSIARSCREFYYLIQAYEEM